MRHPTSFDKESRRMAAVLADGDRAGIPKDLRTLGPCVDCGRLTREDYLCRVCQREHGVAPLRTPAA